MRLLPRSARSSVEVQVPLEIAAVLCDRRRLIGARRVAGGSMDRKEVEVCHLVGQAGGSRIILLDDLYCSERGEEAVTVCPAVHQRASHGAVKVRIQSHSWLIPDVHAEDHVVGTEGVGAEIVVHVLLMVSPTSVHIGAELSCVGRTSVGYESVQPKALWIAFHVRAQGVLECDCVRQGIPASRQIEPSRVQRTVLTRVRHIRNVSEDDEFIALPGRVRITSVGLAECEDCECGHRHYGGTPRADEQTSGAGHEVLRMLGVCIQSV